MHPRNINHFLESLDKLREMTKSTDPKTRTALAFNAIATFASLTVLGGFLIWLCFQ